MRSERGFARHGRADLRSWLIRRLGPAILAAGIVSNGAAHAADAGNGGYSLGHFEFLGNGPSYLDLGAGIFDLLGESDNGNKKSAVGRVEFRYGEKLFAIGPLIGLMANTDGGVFGYVGVYSDIRLDRFVLTPIAAAGGYHQGDSKFLGGTFQFRIGLGLAYEFADNSRFGVRLDHISNARLHEHNPGEEELLLTYSIPLNLGF